MSNVRTRPLWRTGIDVLMFLTVLALTLKSLTFFGPFSLGTGNARAMDGDSLQLNKTEVRLHGIDAPEYRQSCKDKHGAEYPCGKQAMNALRSLVRDGEVSCTSIETDRYGRAVAVCKRSDLEINGEMVRLGWAVAYSRHSLSYVRLEAEARRAKRGIWAGSFEPPEDYRARQRLVQGDLSGPDLPD